MPITKFVSHSYTAAKIAISYGWLPGARYTNLRDVRRFDRLGFLDIVWQDYKFRQHLRAAVATTPMVTVARDVERIEDLPEILDEAHELSNYCDFVIVVPKDPLLKDRMEELVPEKFLFGYSVPTRYGATTLSPESFRRPIHLLGGRPDVQRKLAERMHVVSIDCNRFTLDASYGDYFDGEKFRPHPIGGYKHCLSESIKNITALWRDYNPTNAKSEADALR
jgi:hypothetical protein